MNITHFFLLISFFSTSTWAGEAHTHGHFKMSMAFQGSQGQAQFEIPLESFVGFEHKPKNQKQRDQLQKSLELFETSISKILEFDSRLGCELKKKKLETHFESSGHADLDAEFEILCQKSPKASSVVVRLVKTFPKAKKGEFDVLLDDFQKSYKIESAEQTIELK